MLKYPTSTMKKRSNIGRGILLLLAIGITINIFKTSILENEKYQAYANNNQFGSIEISANRGTIYDSNGNTLAKSATVFKVFLDPSDFKKERNYSKKDEIVEFITSVLDIDEETLLRKMDANNQYEVLQTKVESPVADKITAFTSKNKISCISLQEDTKRYYPQNELAASVIGFVNSDGEGKYGIESYYDEELSGIPGKVISAKDAKGDEMPYRYSKLYEAQDGNSLYLTIDSNIQYYLEKNIQDMTEKFQVEEGACAIMMNVKTGAIYGMATTPTYDLNNPADIKDERLIKRAEIAASSDDEEKETIADIRAIQWRNKSVNDRYIPGSVFKVITGSAAIEEKAIDAKTSTFNCPGTVYVAGWPFHCWNYLYSCHGDQDFATALTNSCNPAFIDIGTRLGAEKFAYYFKAFGLTEPTGIDLPAEVSSISVDVSEKGPVELASSSFGQTNKITPMEMLVSYAAVINGGYLVQPYVVDRIVDISGNIISTHSTTVKRQVISADTSKAMREALEAVVNNKGGSNAYIKGYHIGGKSGTSQKLDIYSVEDMRYVASYCCFAPANDPEIILIVIADEPMSGDYYGSVVAVPYARKILEEVLPYLGYYPEYTDEEIEKMDKTVPDLTDKTVAGAKDTLKEMMLECEIVGSGSVVESQVPSSGSLISQGGKVILYTQGSTAQKMTSVPNVTGMNIEQANALITEAGLNYITKGASVDNVSALISSQSIDEGEVVPRGTVIELMFIIKDQSG